MQQKILFSLFLFGCAAALTAGTLLETKFDSPESLTGWGGKENGKIVSLPSEGQYLQVTREKNAPEKGSTGVFYRFHPAQIAGKRLTITVDVKRNIGIPTVKWQGGKVMLTLNAGDKTTWPGLYMPPGKTEWKTMVLREDIPGDLKSAILSLGIQDAQGTICFRNLKIEVGDAVLDLRRHANMGYRDPFAGDGKGGWSDQGPYNDAGNFQFKRKECGGIPFRILNPAENNGKSVLVFQSRRFPNGIKSARCDLSNTGTSGRWLYLLHTLTWGHGFRKTAGFIDLTGKNGKKQTIPVRGGTDVGDWWSPSRLKNAFPASLWQNSGGGTVGVYGSKFKLDPELGELAEITFRASNDSAVWLLLAATLSPQEYSFPKQTTHTIRADNVWRPLPLPTRGGVIPGSALDLSGNFPAQPVGTLGRVIINKEGHLAFEKNPSRPVRFLCATILTDPFGGRGEAKPEFVSDSMISEYAKQLRMQGYNMVRFHYLDAVLMAGSDKDFQFNPKTLDQFDRFIHALKQNGIYVNFDAMASRIGWSHGYSWSAKPGDKRNFKLDIYFNPEVRKNWENGMRALLTRVNPYTKTRLVDDPVLALAVSFNEQEFAFTSGSDFSQAKMEWIRFLKRRYSSIDALKKAWGKAADSYRDFDSIPVFLPEELQESSGKGKDISRFIGEQESALALWYRETLRKIGFRGLIASFNMGQALRHIAAREANDYIALNGYHAHPFGNAMDPEGSIAGAGKILRGFASTRVYGKPFVCTEHGHAFWNSYRYEQGFVMGAYAAFQAMDGLTAFSNQITVRPEVHTIKTFQLQHDVILKSQELLTAFLFRRGDVKTAESLVRVRLDPEAIYSTGVSNEALHSGQTLLALVTGFAVETGDRRAVGKNQTVIPAAGGSSLIIRRQGTAGYTQATDSHDDTFQFDEAIQNLKQAKFLPENNRSSEKQGLYESSTGELFLNAKKHFMSINTPRFQGICGEAGTTAKLKEFEIKELGVRGNLSALSLENGKTLADSEHILIVFATNALNTGMVFEDAKHRTRIQNGRTPILLETGRFRAALSNRNAGKFKLYALGIDGKRLAELPLTRSSGTIGIDVDTAAIPNGPALYFELTAK